MREMERKGRRRKFELRADRASGQALGALLHKQAIHGEARWLRKGAQCFDRLTSFHVSRIIET
jgi:hypothetical protein